MDELSSKARATLSAYRFAPAHDCVALAAALRAAADQVVPAPRCPYHSCCDVYAAAIRAELLAIAVELEAHD
jgi:hypothetical protein